MRLQLAPEFFFESFDGRSWALEIKSRFTEYLKSNFESQTYLENLENLRLKSGHSAQIYFEKFPNNLCEATVIIGKADWLKKGTGVSMLKEFKFLWTLEGGPDFDKFKEKIAEIL